MTLWVAMLIIFLAGLIGGTVNALLTDNGFVAPKNEVVDGRGILRPGVLGNMLVGGVAALISWGLYGPASSLSITTPGASLAGTTGDLTAAAFAGAILIGVAGARWLTNEVDKQLLRAAATQAAASEKSDALATKMALATPAEALAEAKRSGGVTPANGPAKVLPAAGDATRG
jgi:hypothetical protein